MYDREVFGFVPGKYSIYRGVIGRGNLIQRLSLTHLVDDFFGGRRVRRGCLDWLRSDNQPLADHQPGGREMIP